MADRDLLAAWRPRPVEDPTFRIYRAGPDIRWLCRQTDELALAD